MNTIRATLLVPIALAALAPVLAGAQPTQHATKAPVKKTVTGNKAAKPAAGRKVTCRYQIQHGKKVRICK